MGSVFNGVYIRDGEPFVGVLIFDGDGAWKVDVPDVDFGFILAELSLGLRESVAIGLDARYPTELCAPDSPSFSRMINEVRDPASGWQGASSFLAERGLTCS